MGHQKLTGSQAILGGATILTAPTIYRSLTTSTTSQMKIYGEPIIENTSSDATLGGIKLGGMSYRILQIPFTSASWTTSVTTNFNSGKNVPAGSVVLEAYFDISSAGSSITLTAGTTADPNGFLTGVAPTSVAMFGGSQTNGAVKYGALFVEALAASSATFAQAKCNYFTGGTARNIAIGRSATNLTMPAGNLYIEFMVPE